MCSQKQGYPHLTTVQGTKTIFRLAWSEEDEELPLHRNVKFTVFQVQHLLPLALCWWLKWSNSPTADKVTRKLVLGLIMFRLVVTTSNIFDKGKQFVNGMLKSIPFFSSLLLNFQLKSIWTTGEERVKEEGAILQFLFFFLRWSTALFSCKKYFYIQLKRKVFPFLSTTIDIKLSGRNSRCPNAVTLTPDYSKKTVT